jgi:ubiquinone biosynthesis protein UbiJ
LKKRKMTEPDVEIYLEGEDFHKLRFKVDETADAVTEVVKLLNLNQRAMLDNLESLKQLSYMVKALNDRIEALERK